MSAAAARRRKQLAARQASADPLADLWDESKPLDESEAYEKLQLVQSQVRKTQGADLAHRGCLALLRKGQWSVATSLMDLLLEVLAENMVDVTDLWIDRLLEVHTAALAVPVEALPNQEVLRLHRLQREWLRNAILWSSATVKFGHAKLHEALGHECWTLASLPEVTAEDVAEWQADAVQHMMWAEQPQAILAWLQTLPKPTETETKAGHTCPPGIRDQLLTRSVLLAVAMENLRDANTLVRAYLDQIEERNTATLQTSYTSKDDGVSPSHILFHCMLLRICEKDVRTGPLFSWLLRSFQRELSTMQPSPAPWLTKIGKVYFHIQPPPSMLNMMENMMGMMGGGGGGINPAMMQAAMAQMQAGGMM